MRATALKLTAALSLAITAGTVQAQTTPPRLNVVTTAVPFLRISPDARAGGMGDLALATDADAASSFYNMGKVPFNKSRGGINATYTPWLRELVNDVYLASLSGFYKFDDQQALSASLRYFSLGDIQFTDQNGTLNGNGKPREFGIDVGYSRKLSDRSGLGLNVKYINSDLASGAASGGNTYKAGSAVAADLGFYHNRQNAAGQGWSFGAALNNLGSKIAYTDNADQRDFIPANIGIGTTYTKVFDETNKLTFGVDINKLLVPTPPVASGNTSTDSTNFADYRSRGVLNSWFKSFGDAPDGASEEFKELQLSFGAEYMYNDQFAFRAGYFHEDKTKGNRRFFTLGLGLKYNVVGLNFSYLIPSGGNNANQNPLANTLRFSLLFDFDGDGGGTASTMGN